MISLVVAMSRNGVIGKDNKLPWHLSEDLKRFKGLTMGHPIIMGRKTFDSIGKPLPGRENIVVTRAPALSTPGVTVSKNLDALIEKLASSPAEAFVIGGSEIYAQTLPHARRLHITLIDQDFEGDAYFPDLNWNKNFKIVSEEGPFVSEKGNLPYRFITAERSIIPENVHAD